MEIVPKKGRFLGEMFGILHSYTFDKFSIFRELT
jgi:hypothetical protein